MVAHRRKAIIKSRRRLEDDEADELASETAQLEDDSLSEATALSDMDDEDADADGSDISEQEDADTKEAGVKDTAAAADAAAANGHATAPNGKETSNTGSAVTQREEATSFVRADTEMMRSGGKLPPGAEDVEEVAFEDLVEDGVELQQEPTAEPVADGKRPGKSEVARERRRRNQDEYRRKRDSDPTFVPNRGGFFMHDHRHAGPAANGFRPFSKGRGRGRGVNGKSLTSAERPTSVPGPMSEPWAHDLHEVVAGKAPRGSSPRGPAPNIALSSRPPSKQGAFTTKTGSSNRSFSRSTQIGITQIRVFLPQMKDHITFSNVPVKQHTRLPQHRPPLRRDKPVRISLPSLAPRYVFPHPERSFIFIPRALRPNQQGFSRGGVRGDQSYRGHSSRQPSAYGWSVYSPSVPMSRQSSLATLNRDSGPPGGSAAPYRHAGGFNLEAAKPVVRLPPATENFRHAPPMHGQAGPNAVSLNSEPIGGGMPTAQAHRPMQQFSAQPESRVSSLPVHQPRPQKVVSMANIDTSSKMPFPPLPPQQQQQQQPFQRQAPQEINGNTFVGDASRNSHSYEASYFSLQSTATPSQVPIPERAIHAQPFQPQNHPTAALQAAPPPPAPLPLAHAPHPMHAPYGSVYPAGAAPQTTIYYPPPDPRAVSFAAPVTSAAATGPIYVSGQPQGGYMVAVAPSGPGQPQAPPPPPPPPLPPHSAPPTGTVAQESNGMVYYYDAAQLYGAGVYPGPTFTYVASGGAAAVGVGRMMSPAPDGYYYHHHHPQAGPGTIYYGA